MSLSPCERCQSQALRFVDASSDLDRPLRLLASLCLAAVDREHLDDDTLSELGTALQQYLGRRVVLEHVFFGRVVELSGLDDATLTGELARLRYREPVVPGPRHSRRGARS